MAAPLECPHCHAPMTSRLDVDGLQHTLHAKCDGCGFELDLGDAAPPRFSWGDRLAIALASAALLALVSLAASLEQFEKMMGDFGSQLPKLTELTLRYQLPMPFLIASGLVSGLGAWRQAHGKGAGRALLWAGCALGVGGALACAWGLYGPVFEMAGRLKE